MSRRGITEPLAEVGRALGERILVLGIQADDTVVMGLTGAGIEPRDDASCRQFVLEMFAFLMHLADRRAFEILGAGRRGEVIDAMVGRITANFDQENEAPLLIETYNRRQLEYAKCRKLLADVGEPMKGTSVWEFSTRLVQAIGARNPVPSPILILQVTDISIEVFKAVDAVLGRTTDPIPTETR